MSTNPEVYEGGCLCGGVKVKVVGPPVGAGLCHCESCRTWHAAPVNAWAIWMGDAVSVTQGEDLLVGHDTGTTMRHWCSHCGSGLINRKPDGMVVVYAMVLVGSGYVHQPSCHIYCEETVFDMQDGLPKYVDLPTEWGGSGETVEEPSRTGMHPGTD